MTCFHEFGPDEKCSACAHVLLERLHFIRHQHLQRKSSTYKENQTKFATLLNNIVLKPQKYLETINF